MRVTPEFLSLIFVSALKGTVILGLAALAAVWLRRGSAASRHLAWQLGLIGVLALPVAIALYPSQKQLQVLPLPFLRSAVTASTPSPSIDETNAPAPPVNVQRD